MTQYKAGKYIIKYKGRGEIHRELTKQQAKVLIELCKNQTLELESVEHIN